MSLIKVKVKTAVLGELFNKRKHKAEQEYKDTVSGTSLDTKLVNYRNNMFNPLGLLPREITGLEVLQPESEEGKALNRYIRVLDDIAVADGYLTYILNFVETMEEFDHIVNGLPIKIKPAKLSIFMEENQDKIGFLKRMRILSECIT